MQKLTAKNKSKLLNDAVDLLEQVALLTNKALGADTDVGFETRTRIEELKEDLIADIVEFDHQAGNRIV
jgi:hypothetical protein